MTPPQRIVTLISLLRRTSQLMVDEITERLEAAGFTDLPPAYHPIFENIDPQGTRLTVLAARARLTHQSMGEIVAELQRRGYVERVADPTDGRARLVRLTAAGRDVVRTAIREIAAIEAKWQQRWRRAGLKGELRGPFEAALRQEDVGASAAAQPTPATARAKR
ncbi:MarR family winged helix-turn-helix transcriptional regulator [Vineibacter terrae]|uniref:MarR family winged helix-turn-helix transcriptional regulator n=1 Tax=Vineibacter terrae TaxID=2586908 RepID=UPI002E345644|nr:MarR family transcriptional regulator [Vineibacter terrae]HEX2892100.1 MarR family transcriptional regulator [Vineibacter terrae]